MGAQPSILRSGHIDPGRVRAGPVLPFRTMHGIDAAV